MSSPTLFPNGKGDPTNNSSLVDTSDWVTEAFANKLKHLIKFGEKKDGNGWNVDLLHTLYLHTVPLIYCIEKEFSTKYASKGDQLLEMFLLQYWMKPQVTVIAVELSKS